MAIVDNPIEDGQVKQQLTLDDLATRIDVIGKQMDWLIDNLQSLFQFVNAMGASGGGLRGMMKALKAEAPALTTMEEQDGA